MTPNPPTPTTTLHVGDCRDVLATMDAESIDAVVTDPPYEIGFMSRKWDSTGVAFDPATWDAISRVMKPGAFLLAMGGTRTFHRMAVAIEDAGFEIKDCLSYLYGAGFPKHKSLLKPGWEPIVVAKKRGAGGLQIEACRIEAEPRPTFEYFETDSKRGFDGGIKGSARTREMKTIGRWPANVVLDEVAAQMLDEAVGERRSAGQHPTRFSNGRGYNGVGAVQGPLYDDTGGPSRFFYTSKASRAERSLGLPPGTTNDHPTVKPLSLMDWLVRLVCPPGGVVLDPFMGSGSTGCAAVRQGFRFVGIDQDAHYVNDLAAHRIAYWSERQTVRNESLFAMVAD